MLFLIAAFVCSGGMAITLRLAENNRCCARTVTAANYVVAAAVSLAFVGGRGVLPVNADMRMAAALGSVNGVLYLLTFLLYQINIRRNGTPLTASFSRLGVLVPTVLSLLVFGERPEQLQWLGIALALAAIIVINYTPGEKREGGAGKMWLVVLFCVAGTSDMMSKVFETMVHDHTLGETFVFYVFLVALAISLVRLAAAHERLRLKDCCWGLAVGVLNYLSTLALLKAILVMPAFIAYPVYSVGVIIFVNFINFIFLKEPLTKRQYAGMAIIAAALVCLNI